jgi:hypothetical protein
MTKVLRTVRGHWRRLSSFSSKLCIFGQFVIGRLVIMLSLFFLLIIRCFLLYTFCVPRVPYASNDIFDLFIKKKKIMWIKKDI